MATRRAKAAGGLATPSGFGMCLWSAHLWGWLDPTAGTVEVRLVTFSLSFVRRVRGRSCDCFHRPPWRNSEWRECFQVDCLLPSRNVSGSLLDLYVGADGRHDYRAAVAVVAWVDDIVQARGEVNS